MAKSSTLLPENNTISIGTFSRAIDYAPHYIARQHGWFTDLAKKHNINITHTEFQSLAPINEAFATGKLDFIFAAEPPAIIGRAAGVDIRIMGIGASLMQEVIIPEKANIQSIQDLKGQKVAVLSGTSSHYGLLKIAEQAGLSRRDLTLIDMIPPDAKVAFLADHVDAWAVWPPWGERPH